MICCDSCDEWFHGACVKVTEEESKLFTKYFCPSCLKGIFYFQFLKFLSLF